MNAVAAKLGIGVTEFGNGSRSSETECSQIASICMGSGC
jgi:hypothetical protein